MFARIVLFLLLALFAPKVAFAHTVGLSSGEYAVAGGDLTLRIVFAGAEVGRVFRELDSDHDGFISPFEVAEGRARLRRDVVEKIEVKAGVAGCPLTLVDAAVLENDGLLLVAKAECGSRPTTVSLHFLSTFPNGHKHVARILDPEPHDELLSAARDSFSIASSAAEASSSSPSAGWFGFIRLGVAHILSGVDHLLFLVALVLGRRSLRELILPITAFTVAHSISLALAVFQIVHVNGRVVEPVIAFSIAWMAYRSIHSTSGGRALTTFVFGLVHGLGFAGALLEIQIPRAQLPVALLCFNGGVEVGQMMVVLIALPAFSFLRQRAPISWKIQRTGMVALIAIGLAWGVLRILAG